MTKRAKQGDLMVWNIINMPSMPNHHPVIDIDHARRLIDCLAESQWLDDEIISNAFGLEVFDDGEWIEWHDEEGRDIDEHFENENENDND